MKYSCSGPTVATSITGSGQTAIPTSVFAAYQGMFAIITVGLITGAIAERMKYSALMAFVLGWMLLVYFPLAVILDRKLYKVTRNPYLGGAIFALIMTIMACTNTLSQLP